MYRKIDKFDRCTYAWMLNYVELNVDKREQNYFGVWMLAGMISQIEALCKNISRLSK